MPLDFVTVLSPFLFHVAVSWLYGDVPMRGITPSRDGDLEIALGTDSAILGILNGFAQRAAGSNSEHIPST